MPLDANAATIARPLAGVVFVAVIVFTLVPDPPQDAVVLPTTAFVLAVAGFVMWRLNIPSYSGMDSVRLRVHVAGNAAMLATCGTTACVRAILLPPGPALAAAVGFSCAAALVAVRLWLVADARHRFTVWRR